LDGLPRPVRNLLRETGVALFSAFSGALMTRLSALAAVFALTSSLSAHADDYTLDSAHSKAGFSVKHMMVSTVRGQFSNVTGTIHFDPKDVSKTTIEASIDATTIDTQEPKRDTHLKSPDFFDVEKFPTITFKSTKASKGSKGSFKVQGDLTMHGVTKSVELVVEEPTTPVKDLYGNLKVGTTATTKVNRKDFGLNWNKALEAGGVLVGEEVTITLDIEAQKK
jgi:polyisoprenoid-binding protein YceI